MVLAPTGVELAAVVSRLRAAGCVFAQDEAALLVAAAGSAAELEALVVRRVAGLPLEQVVGRAEFCGVLVRLSPGVFVPRARTELLVREAVRLAGPGSVLLDLCCGSGAIGLAVAASVPVSLFAADIEPASVACARVNLEPAGGAVFEGDLFAALPPALLGRVDILTANVPYVPTGEIELMPAEARLYEPRAALDGGPDGLDVLRRVAAGAGGWLAPAGHLLVETSERQLPAASAVLEAAGLAVRAVRDEELEATLVVGRSTRTS